MANDFYCGIKKDRKKRRIGSMKECLEADKVNYYGVKKIDPKLIEKAKSLKKKPTADKVWIKLVGVRAKFKKLQEDIKYLKDEGKKKKAKEESEKVKVIIKELAEEFKKLKAIENEKKNKLGGNKRSGSQYGGKRGSKKSKGSKSKSRSKGSKGSKGSKVKRMSRNTRYNDFFM
ncbi:hypothetical protein Catovirus_1_925 [Catovirus CTV1]|uniref:Uncharacterized protein n=1 Tax=Catovirus CTV1 TaxID=1977631 RepID=A0A1V0SAY2_9VIRU|nr:hypothetical protein Catovirus_1_925 [Catovirus CTV1]